jgi:hypothetical protein
MHAPPLIEIKVAGAGRRESMTDRGVGLMSYLTLLLHMAIGQSNEARLSAARYLAERFDALVIGAAACDPQPPASLEGIYPVGTIVADRSYAQERLDTAEDEFRQAFKARENRIEWHARTGSSGGVPSPLRPSTFPIRAGQPILSSAAR